MGIMKLRYINIINSKDVARLVATLEKGFSLSQPISDLPIRTYSLENISPLIYAIEILDPGNVNCAIEFYLQTGVYSDKLQRCKLMLFQQICHEPVFDFLRTKEQLGYIVFDGIRKPTGFIGYRIIIQSEKDPIYLESRIEAFLEQMEEKLRLMTHQEFEKHQSSLTLKLIEKHKNLSQEAGRIWSHIQSGYYEFDQNIQDVSIIKRLNLTDIQTFYSTTVKKNATERKKFSVHIQRKNQAPNITDGKVITIDTLAQEKKEWKLGPRPYCASTTDFIFKSNF